ncbi:TPA: hypothetical protein ACH3X1_010869 [Trebouxia sp. C0004]
MASLDLFEGCLVQQSVEEERLSMLPPSHMRLQGPELGSAAAVPSEADASPNISFQPVLLRSQARFKRAMSGLSAFISSGILSSTAPAAPATAPMQPQADTGASFSASHSSGSNLGSRLFSRVSVGSRLLPAHSFIPGLLYSSMPTLTAVQPLQQPISDPDSHLTNSTIGQGELAGDEHTHPSSREAGAGDVSLASSSGLRGALVKNTSSLAEAIEREFAAEKAAMEEADKVFLEKTNKPQKLQCMSSSLKDFTIKAFRRSKDVEAPDNIEEQQTAAPERSKFGAKAKEMAARFVPAALGGSPRPYVTPGGLIALAEESGC